MTASLAAGSSSGAERPAGSTVPPATGTKAKNRFHPDLTTTDQPAEVDRMVAAGAKRLGDFVEDGISWTTLVDPEGNEFDIVAS